MSTLYILPQPIIHQIFQQTVAAPIRRLHACIVGPNAQVLRYSEASEKAQIYIGQYSHTGELIDGDYKKCYSWPERPTGAIVEQDSVRLFIDNALLRIFRDTSGTMTKTAVNKLTHPSVNFATHGDYARNDALLRDIQPGDVVSVKATGTDDEEKTAYSYVLDSEGETIASSISAVTAYSANATSQAADTDITEGADNAGDVELTADGDDYDGLADGLISDTYVITVTQASTGGDATTARLRVTSASGKDDDFEVTPAAWDAGTAIGANGLIVTFSSEDEAFIEGDTFTVVVSQVWEAPALSIAGTYTGTKDRTYIVEVTKGGLWADGPKITVQAADGSDRSGPTTITISSTVGTTTTATAGAAYTVAVALGQYGITGRFSDEGLRLGDRYTFTATAATEGAQRTLTLAHNLDELIPLDDDDAAIELAIYIRKNVEITKKHIGSPGDYAFTAGATQVCVFAGVKATDDSWAEDGVAVPLPVITDLVVPGSNKMYVEYRAWLQAKVGVLNALSDISDIDQIPGALNEENPLKYAMSKALANNNGQPVRYIAVSDPTSLSAWTDALGIIKSKKNVYNIAPLSYDQAVLEAVEAHVQAQSGELAARWRGAFFGLQGVTTKDLVTAALSSDAETVMATAADDPGTTGTQYTLLTITSGNADLLTLDVRAGDVVRYKFTSDAWGDESYSDYVIDDVLTEDSLRLVSGPSTAEPTPLRIEIYRDLTRTEQAEEIGRNARAWDSARIKAVWLDNVTGGQPTVATYYVAAAEAALVGGVAPHQPVTHVNLNGFDGLSGVTSYFDMDQLNTMAGSGVWILEENEDGVMYNRHAVTTADPTLPKLREESYGRNVDSISYYFWDLFAPFIGKSNVTEDLMEVLRTEIKAGIQFLRESGRTPMLGGQMRDATVVDIHEHVEFPDRIVIKLSCNLPFPFNNAEVFLLV